MRTLYSDPFQGGAASRYADARRSLRTQAAAMLDVPVKRVRIAPGAVTLQLLRDDQWIAYLQDVVDEHEWRVRHHPPTTWFRLVLRL